MKQEKGFSDVTNALVVMVLLVMGFVLLISIYLLVTSDSPGLVNTITNMILDALLGWAA